MNPMHKVKTTTFVTGLLALSCAGIAIAAEKKQDEPHAEQKSAASIAVKNIGVTEFEKLRGDKKNVVLDVRTPKEFEAGHIPGALNIDWRGTDFAKKVGALDKSKTYLVHCASGGRSAQAGEAMGKLNFKRLYNLEGGMKAWEKAGNKAEK